MQSLTWPVHGSVGEERGGGEKIGFYHYGSCHMDANMWRRRRAAVSPQWLFCASSLNLLAHFIQVTALRCCGWIVIFDWATAGQYQDNADILRDIQSGALSVEDPKGAEALRHLDMVKFKEVLKRKFLEGPGSNQSAWEQVPLQHTEVPQGHAQQAVQALQKQKLAMLKITTRGHHQSGEKKVTYGSKGGHLFFSEPGRWISWFIQLPKDPDMSWERDFCGDGMVRPSNLL